MAEANIIHGDRLYLRPIRQTDVSQRYCDWLNDSEVNRYLETRYQAQTMDDIAEFVRQKIASMDEYLTAICLNDGDRHIGNIKLGPVRARHELADVSLFIGDRNCWGMGYASEAIACITRFALMDLNLNKVSASIYGGNQGSYHAFIKAGWRHEAILRKHYVHDDGPMDIILMGLCRDEYEART